MSTTYTAEASYADRWWSVTVRGLDAGPQHTQARTLRDVAPMAREVVALLTDVDEASVRVDVQVKLPARVRSHLVRAEKLRIRSADANTAAAQETRAAVAELAEAGLTLRDIGAALGVSHQRAAQLLQP